MRLSSKRKVLARNTLYNSGLVGTRLPTCHFVVRHCISLFFFFFFATLFLLGFGTQETKKKKKKKPDQRGKKKKKKITTANNSKIGKEQNQLGEYLCCSCRFISAALFDERKNHERLRLIERHHFFFFFFFFLKKEESLAQKKKKKKKKKKRENIYCGYLGEVCFFSFYDSLKVSKFLF